MFRKSQTATEYLIILGVVIIIAIITVGTLSDVVGLGGGLDEQTARLTLAAQTIAITDYAVTDYDTVLTFRNNHKNSVILDEIWINNEQCLFFISDIHRLNPGQSKDVICQNVYELEETSVEYPVVINWTDITTDAQFTQSNSDAVIITDVSNKYLNILQSNLYWDESINGCYNNTVSPIPICSCVDLNKTRDNLASNHSLQNSVDFIRCNDEFNVDFRSGEGWEPIVSFNSRFIGNNNIISQLYIDSTSTSIGFFSNPGNIFISDLGLSKTFVNGLNSVGGLISSISTEFLIENVYVQGSINGTTSVGGIIGSIYSGDYSSNILRKSFFSGEVRGNSAVGGITGYVQNNGRIYDSVTFGEIYGISNIGGIAGTARDDDTVPILTNIASTVQILNCVSNCGGLVGGYSGISGGEVVLEGLNYWVNYSLDTANLCTPSRPSNDGLRCTAVSSIKDIPIR